VSLRLASTRPGAVQVQAYDYFVHDDRRDSPVRRRAHVQGSDDARRLAERILRETYHHVSVEVWSQGERVFMVTEGEENEAA
jgi:hypothetical protein